MAYNDKPDLQKSASTYQSTLESLEINEKFYNDNLQAASLVYNCSTSGMEKVNASYVIDWFNRSSIMSGCHPIHFVGGERYFNKYEPTAEPERLKKNLEEWEAFSSFYDYNADDDVRKLGIQRSGAVLPSYRRDVRAVSIQDCFYELLLAGYVTKKLCYKLKSYGTSTGLENITFGSKSKGAITTGNLVCNDNSMLNHATFAVMGLVSESNLTAVDIGVGDYSLYINDNNIAFLWDGDVEGCEKICSYTAEELVASGATFKGVPLLSLTDTKFPIFFKPDRNRTTAKLFYDDVGSCRTSITARPHSSRYNGHLHPTEEITLRSNYISNRITIDYDEFWVSTYKASPDLISWAERAITDPVLKNVFDKAVNRPERAFSFEKFNGLPVVIFPEGTPTSEYTRVRSLTPEQFHNEGNLEYIASLDGEVRYLSGVDFENFKIFHRSMIGGLMITSPDFFALFIDVCIAYSLVPCFNVVATKVSLLTKGKQWELTKDQWFDKKYETITGTKDTYRREIYFKNLLSLSKDIDPVGVFDEAIRDCAIFALNATSFYDLNLTITCLRKLDFFAKKSVYPLVKANPEYAGDCLKFIKIYLHVLSFIRPLQADRIWRNAFGEGILLTKLEDYITFEPYLEE